MVTVLTVPDGPGCCPSLGDEVTVLVVSRGGDGGTIMADGSAKGPMVTVLAVSDGPGCCSLGNGFAVLVISADCCEML